MPLPTLLYEDEALLAFDKPAGVPVMPEPGVTAGLPALMTAVRARWGAEISNVHRLDSETGGVLLCAKTKAARDSLSGQFQGKTAQKIWHALVAVLPPERLAGAAAPARTSEGAPPDTFAIDLPIAEDEHQRGRMLAGKWHGSRPATTEFRTLENFGSFAWMECRPLTGRPHQVRVHLAAAGLPVLNDVLYGAPDIELRLSAFKRGYKGREAERPLIHQLALHATGLIVRHPTTAEPVTFTVPLPPKFEVALKNLRKFASGKR